MPRKVPHAPDDAFWLEGRAAWPAIPVRREQLSRYLRELSGREGSPPLDALDRPDVYLVCACLQGIPEAIEAFDRTQIEPVRRILLRKMTLDSALLDDVLQRLRTDLFARGSRPSKLLSYSGKGKVRAWLTTVAIRAAREVLPADSKAPQTLGSVAAATARTPELEFLRATHQEHFRAAFSEAMAALSARERNLLRLHLLDGLNVDRIGATYDVHRATAARWIAAARERLVSETRRLLARRLGLHVGEVDSLMALLTSQLDLSISRHLRDDCSPIRPFPPTRRKTEA